MAAGLALGLFLAGPGGSGFLGIAAANETDNGDAEAAPASVMSELAETKLVVETSAETSAAADEYGTGASVSRARIFAHTAQLQQPMVKASSRPLFPVEMPASFKLRAPSLTAQPASAGDSAAAAAAPLSSPPKLSRSQLVPAKVKPVRRARLPLAPSAAEIRREIAARNGGPDPAASAQTSGVDKSALGARLEQRATEAPTQNTRWPTHVDYSAGPGGPAGANTAGDRKGSMIEVTGPQQGVIRNRW